ncbi:hypothetical protein KY330_05225 [Candidatus Woesearchaeota archaeon]|nr:hypothetical protein [Candidatus Woesearchaeota archaeon]
MAKRQLNNLLIPGGLLLGLGLGMIYNQVAGGTLIGLGLGFIAAFIFGKKN